MPKLLMAIGDIIAIILADTSSTLLEIMKKSFQSHLSELNPCITYYLVFDSRNHSPI
jgi:hypothetical protein